ncbi:Cna B-type domain-containing protein [Bacillus mobilis]|nr:Cna B-type domain-containing protein [Bacillus mobilis]SCB92341.1 LPXTG-domain-containing protein cell wall anchor domain [Bacillus mobilis]
MNSKRIISIFSIIMIFMFTIGQSLLPIVVNAQELNTAGLVDNFTIGKTNLQTGESTNVSVNFSEKNGVKLKPGDTLTLTLPPELEGFKGTIQLKDYGICKVNQGTVVCTFNDKVAEYKDIQGYLNFNVTATGVGTDQKKEIDTNLGTNVDKQHITITGPKGGGSTGEKPFFYKAGDMRGNEGEVRWFLNINNDKKELSRDIIVTDKLQEGQIFNENSFYITVDDYLGKQRLTPQQLESKGYGKVTFNDDNSFKIVLNQSRARLAAFVVEYTSTITEAGMSQEDFKNDYTIDYQILHKDSVFESGTAKTQNMSASGGINGVQVPKGKLRIFKHIEGNKEKAIQNVSFKLYKESGEQVGGEYKTNEKGLVQTEQLPPGKYYVQEVSAPDYIDFDPKKKVEFEIKSDAENGIELPISNNVKTTSVSGTKIWNDNNNKFGKRPERITVQLLQNGTEFKTQEVKADEKGNWAFSFEDLPKYDGQGNEYKYTVDEVKVDGYETKVEGTTITNTYKNTETTEVNGKKVWEDYDNKFGTRPGSIKVQLLQNGTEFKAEEVKADKEGNWTFSFKDLPKYDEQGKEFEYTVDEVKVKDYETKVEGTTITNTYKNTETTEVSGKKVWEDNNAIDRPLSIKVDLLQNGKVIDTKEVSVGTNWKYTFEKLQVYDANGLAYKYEVKEQPVEGYKSEVNGYDITNTKIKDEQHTDPKDPSTNPKDPSTDPKDPSTDPKDPSTDPKDPSTDPKDPSTDPKDPSTDPKDPSTDPKDPSTDPKDPSTDPKDPSTDPKDPSTDPKDPSTDPKDPSTDPKDPSTDPKDPSTDPKDPSTDPKDPSTNQNANTEKNSDSKAPPITENDKPTLLPNTGGTSTDSISILGGMILLALGGILFARQRIKQ